VNIAQFVSDKTAYILLTSGRLNIIVLNAGKTNWDLTDDSMDSFSAELQQMSDQQILQSKTVTLQKHKVPGSKPS
jgi:hypothetical protein